MKKLTFGMILSLIAITLITACNKWELAGQSGKIIASAYKVRISQPDSLLLSGAKSTDSVSWSVTPAGADSLIKHGAAALVFFKKAGVYQVKAVDKNLPPASVSISVSDSVYHPPVQYIYTPLTGDQITLVPHYVASGDSTYLSFVAQTKNNYCTTSHLQFTDSLINNKYGINFIRVLQFSPCPGGDTPIAAVINFSANQPAALLNGTYPLSVTLNDTTYNGSIVVNPTTINFNWSYTRRVLISPQQISR
jgi:hypothetical protein